MSLPTVSPFKEQQLSCALWFMFSITSACYAHKKESEFQKNGKIGGGIKTGVILLDDVLNVWLPQKLPIIRLYFLLHSAIFPIFRLPIAIANFEQDSSILVWVIWVGLIAPGLYLLACDPLPPKKIEEWEKAKEAGKLEPVYQKN